MTPTVPPMTESAPVPRETSASSRSALAPRVNLSVLVAIVASSDLLRDDLEVHGRDDEVDDEEQHEGDDDALVHRVADALGTTARVEPLVGRDDGRDGTEDQGLDLGGPEVGQLGQRGEARDVRARCAALDDDVEDVAADDADDRHEPVEQ